MKLEQVLVLKKELVALTNDLAATSPATLPGMVAIEIPQHIIKQWGLRVSNPHITLFYLPETRLYDLNKIARRIQKLLIDVPRFEITTQGQDWFGPKKDTRVVLVQPSLDLAEIRLRIYDMMEREFPGMMDKKYPVYKPHITIGKAGDYLGDGNTNCVFEVEKIIIQLYKKDTFQIVLRNS